MAGTMSGGDGGHRLPLSLWWSWSSDGRVGEANTLHRPMERRMTLHTIHYVDNVV